jgi:hypothetical protein
MTQPRAADDFAMIRARMKKLRRERERAEATESELPSDPPARPARIGYWSQREVELRRDRSDELGRREQDDQLTR